MKDLRSRRWSWTLNNYTAEDLLEINKIPYKYIIYGDEYGKNNTNHLQGYLEFADAKSFTRIKKYLPKAHIEKSRGTPMENKEYCSKDGIVLFEDGDISKQGQRTDLEEVARQVRDNEKTAEQVAIEDPQTYHTYGRTLHKIEDILLRKQYRKKMTEGKWLWGETGVGKSKLAFEGYNPETHYVFPNDGGWWDGYTGQKIVIINEFRGEIKYSELLELIDWTPKSVRRRGREPAPFLAEEIIITSSMRPEEVYHNIDEKDSIEQLKRRITIIQVK